MPTLYRAAWLLDVENGKPIDGGGLITDGSHITAVGPADELRRSHPDADVVNFGSAILFPAFINAHTHAAMVGFRGYADDLPLESWLGEHIFPAEARAVSETFVRDGLTIACAELMASGVSTFLDMYFHIDTAAEVVERAGLRAFIGEGIIDFATPSAKTPDIALASQRAFTRNYANHSNVRPYVCLHSPYTCSPDLIQAGRALADETGVPFCMHVSETQREVEEIKERYGKTPFEHLESLGVLEGLIAAHGVWPADGEPELMAQRGVTVAHCPQSNAKLGSGIAPVERYFKAGVNVALGTDGAASNNDLDMVEEMRFAALLHKAEGREPVAFDAVTALQTATLGGARAVGMEGIAGSLSAGKSADFGVLSLERTHAMPHYNPFSHLVYAAKSSDVTHLYVMGKEVYADGRPVFVDENELRDAAERMKRRVQSDES